MSKEIKTFAEYMANRVSTADREQVNFEIALIGKMIEARAAKGLSQRNLAEMSGLKQPAIARLESLKATPQIDTLFKILVPLGYTLSIVPIEEAKEREKETLSIA